MGQVALFLELVGALAFVPAGLVLLGRRARRRGVPGSVLSPFEEIWDPVAHTTQVQVQVQAERLDPCPAPGDPPRPVAAAVRSPRPEVPGHVS